VNRGGGRKSFAAESRPEITTIRFLERDPILFIAPRVVEELLRADGFADIRYVDVTLEHVRRAETAKKLIAEYTDCRFLNELKRE
jgi:hypothetical protein